MRPGPLLLLPLLAACATTQKGGDEDTQVFLLEVVTQHCKIPQLKTFFEFDSVHVGSDNHAALNALAKCLTDGPLNRAKIELIGHSDPVGPAGYNEKLSLRRAKEVARYLANRGVPDARISVRAAGVDEDAPANRMARRVDIRLIDCAIDPKRQCESVSRPTPSK